MGCVHSASSINSSQEAGKRSEDCTGIPFYNLTRERDEMTLWKLCTLMLVIVFVMTLQALKRTPSSRQKRAIIKIDDYRFEPKYTAAGVRYPSA